MDDLQLQTPLSSFEREVRRAEDESGPILTDMSHLKLFYFFLPS